MRRTKEKRVYIEAVASLIGYKLCYYNPGDFGRYRLTRSGNYFDTYKHSALSLADMYTYAVGMLAGYTSVSAEAEAVGYTYVNTYLEKRMSNATAAEAEAAAEAEVQQRVYFYAYSQLRSLGVDNINAMKAAEGRQLKYQPKR